MFGSTISEMEAEVSKLFTKESDLAAKRQAVLGSLDAIRAEAGEEYLSDPTTAVTHLTDAVARAQSEATLLDGAILAVRKKRLPALARLTAGRVSEATRARDGKAEELRKAEERRAALQAELEAATNRAANLTGELATAERNIKIAEFGGGSGSGTRLDWKLGLTPDNSVMSGVVEADSAASLVEKIEALAPLRAVPSAAAVRQWVATVEAVVERERPGLLRPRFEHVTEQHRNADYASDAGRHEVTVVERRVYRLAYHDGLIDTEDSSLRFPAAAAGSGRSGPEYTVAGRRHEEGFGKSSPAESVIGQLA